MQYPSSPRESGPDALTNSGGETMSLCHLCADELYDVGWKGAELLSVWRCPKENADLAFLKN